MRTATATGNPLSGLVSAFKKIINSNPLIEKGSAEAYDIWAGNYDMQPGNLMLDLDEEVFGCLLSAIDLEGKQVADIGCGTGRHWPKLFAGKPASLTGFDVSAGMLHRLEQKFPGAKTQQIADNLFKDIADASYDVVVSTLTVAHIENIEEALNAWCHMAKPKAEIIITDFHPNALAHGGKRTFKHDNGSISIQNFVHYVYDIEQVLQNHGFKLVNKLEKTVNESVKHYYEAQNALHVYEKFKDARIIYGIHLTRGYDTE